MANPDMAAPEKKFRAAMSESGAPPRIHGTGPKRMKSHGFFRRGGRRCPKSDTPRGNDGGRFGTSEIHGSARI